MIHYHDIARGLSMMARFNGHISDFYSVAQHSILVAAHLPDELRPYGLLHDASEAYIADIVRPAKGMLEGYLEIEECLMEAVAARYGLDPKLFQHPLVREADNRALITERNALQSTYVKEHWASLDVMYRPYPAIIVPWDWRIAENNFILAFEKVIDVNHPCPADPVDAWEAAGAAV